MNTNRLFLTAMLIALLGNPIQGKAEDIDIYSGLNPNTTIPNIMVVVDNPSSQNNAVAACTYWDGTPPSNNNQALGADQCALVNLVHSMLNRPDGTALLRLGFTTMSGVDFPLTPVDDNTYTGTTPLTIAGNSVTIPGGTTNRNAIILAVKALAQTTGKSAQGAEMHETWAYYTGGNGTYNGVNTATGLLSGRTYPTTAFPATNAASGCQKNYIIYLSNVKAGASHAQTWTSSELTPLDAAARNALSLGLYGTNTTTSNPTFLKLDPSATGYTGAITYPTQEKPYGLEWARFMFNTDVNTGSTGVQNIITYSVATGETATPGTTITNDMELYIDKVAIYGGGKYFAAGNDPAALQNDILKIFNEVQAVNSVFSSSSLPVSVNAQGTYLNQIYMGMFRPDPNGNPRWLGNLKQYQFILNPTTGALQLGDSLGLAAISSAGTGFISANSISFWTCTNLNTPYANPFLTASPANLTAQQIALLVSNNQSCTDPTGGFWVNDPSSTLATAIGYDLPDGERVERGGVAQQIRHINLTDDYTAAAGSSTNPRNLYTYCPSGTSCVAALTDSSNAFATSNAGITAGQFGASPLLYVNSIVRTGTTALVTTSSPHGYATGNTVTISGATQPEYNVTQAITVNSSTTFTITGLPDNPPSPNTGNYTAALHNSSTKAITSMSVATSTTANANKCTSGTIPNINCDQVTVTVPNHGYSNGNSIVIAGVSPSQYSGTFVIGNVTTNTFTYNVTVTPTSPSVNAYSAQLPTPAAKAITNITKSGSNFVVTATAHGFTNGQSVTISGNSVGAYNGTWTVSSAATNTFNIGASGNPGTGTGGSAILNQPVIPIAAGNISRASATATTATATGITASAFSNGQTVNLAYVSGGSANETAYAPYPTGNNSVVITCSGTCTSFTFPITTAPSTTLTLSSPTAALAATPVTIPAGAITRSSMGTTATVTGVANTFTSGQSIDIGVSGAPVSSESAYLSPAAGWTITCPSACSTAFTFGSVTLSPVTPATGTIRAQSFSTSPDKTTLINWVRGQDNQGDEYGPGGSVNIRPSVHGDVLHSRPTVINYGSYSVAIISTSDSGTTRTATASTANVTTIASFGATPVVTFANGQACPVTVASATTFTYLNTGCGASGAQTASVGSKVVVFYGDNGGIFHAVNGNQTAMYGTAGAGDEIWGFIPSEFFYKLGRLMSNSPQLNLPNTPTNITPAPQAKDYFIDGVPGVYQVIDGNGNTTKAVIYLSMRRGGRFIYALDVTNPATPTVLWKVDNTSTGMSELGQTWSQPKVARVHGYTNPVLIFGAGYDTNEDSEPLTTADTSGRGIFVLDALTGAVVWSATPSTGTTSYSGNTTQASALVSGMNYSIPADITLVDRDLDGYIDRMYAADTGGNIWRIDLEPPRNNALTQTCGTGTPVSPATTATTAACTPDVWRVYQLAALGCYSALCPNPSNPTQRKFFYPPEVIPATTTIPYDSVIAGSGDREHPLYVYTSSQRVNRLFLLKDPFTGNDASGMTAANSYPIMIAGTLSLSDATSTPWDGSHNGYVINLALGEKVVNAPLVAAGFVYMGTNQPSAPSANSCNVNLGTARGYQLSPFTATYGSVVFSGGGLPPSPVAGIVDIVVGSVVKQMPFLIGGGNPSSTCVGADCSSALGGQKPPITVQTNRTRTYWYKE